MKQLDSNEFEVIIIEDPWTEFVDISSKEVSYSSAHKKSVLIKYPRLPIWISATLLTLIVHSLVFAPFLLGSPARRYQRPMTEGGAASAQNSASGEFVSQLILINNFHVTTTEEENDSPYVIKQSHQRQETQRQEITMLSSTPQLEVAGSENGADVDSPTVEAVGDAAGKAMMFGRYMGQIKARIERAWNYPVNDRLTNFDCTVQIKQSKKGEVMEVAMTRCANNSAWQLSLAKAIQAASPLPAPPDNGVFTEVVTLNLSALR